MVDGWRVVRYLIGGGSSLAIDVALQWVLLELARLPLWLATATSYELALLLHFLINDWWVFGHRSAVPGVLSVLADSDAAAVAAPPAAAAPEPDSRYAKSRRRRLAEYHAAALTAEAITLAITWLLIYGPGGSFFSTGIGPYAAKAAGTATAFIWTFTTSFFWIWRVRPTTPPVRTGADAAGRR